MLRVKSIFWGRQNISVMLHYLHLFTFLFLTISLTGQTTTPDESLKVITYNIWNGFDWGKDTKRHKRFIDWVKEQSPDVFALQELCGYTEEKLREDAASWGHPYSVLLKTKGYPVGLTSRKPIELKERLLEGLWHGMLHAETFGIDFFVVHLSPADYAFREREAAIISEKIKAIENDHYIVLGDFNALSPMDADLNSRKETLLERYRKSDAKNEKHNNLRDEEWDYSVMATFLALPTIDVGHRNMKGADRYSFPTPILIGSYYNDRAHIGRSFQRIDYLMVSPALARQCQGSKVIHNDDTDGLSDHYPVEGIFRIE